ncbi:MAG: hypothetical protein UW03_C0043G0014 [Candidatus Peregrinibacteria bacterium GW2011_GWA2_43_8]|nr:MAG: hypothetical protein UW03_C0043G0014 [Candidatus Peregrinibacteria bacterium GW2011_GWA2_43_8]
MAESHISDAERKHHRAHEEVSTLPVLHNSIAPKHCKRRARDARINHNGPEHDCQQFIKHAHFLVRERVHAAAEQVVAQPGHKCQREQVFLDFEHARCPRQRGLKIQRLDIMAKRRVHDHADDKTHKKCIE